MKPERSANKKEISIYIRAAVIFIAVAALLPLLSPASAATDNSGSIAEAAPSLDNADAVYLYNPESGTVVLSKDPEKLVYPASSVKLMTALVALDKLSGRLSEKITITDDMVAGVSGTRYGLTGGDTVTIRDLFYIAFAGCYNDGAVVLAKLAAGDTESFVTLMNAKTTELGMTNTRYTNPTGMHDRLMRTTAADVAKLALELSKSVFFMLVTSEPKYTLEGSEKKYTVSNRNELVSKVSSGKYYNSLCRGMNLGMTEEAGYSLTTLAAKDGTSYICVIMGGRELEDGTISAYTTATDIIGWAFRNYGYREVLSSSTLICELPVTLSSDVDSVLLVPAASYSYYLPTSAEVGSDITFTTKLTLDSLEAPFTAGVQCGFITVKYNGEVLTTVPLVTKTGVARSELLYQMERIREFSQSRVFIATIVSAVIITLLYNIIRAFLRASKKKKRGGYL